MRPWWWCIDLWWPWWWWRTGGGGGGGGGGRWWTSGSWRWFKEGEIDDEDDGGEDEFGVVDVRESEDDDRDEDGLTLSVEHFPSGQSREWNV